MAAALTLVVMAAGLGRRFGGVKPLVAVGPADEALLDYAVYDAARAGFRRLVLVVRREIEDALRAHVAGAVGKALDVVYVEQRLDDLPAGRVPPPGRAVPWGTAHAVLAARHELRGPFAVCNADDYYGPGAFRLLAEHLATDGGLPPVHALAGYRLDATLSEHGGVARGVALTDGAGFLRRLVEIRDLHAVPGGAAGTVGGERRTFTGTEATSMNLWAFAPEVLRELAAQCAAFVDEHGADLEAEFLLSSAVNAQIAAGRARLRVLMAPDRWCGITYAADVPAVRRALAAAVAAGSYPADLRSAFSSL